MYSIGVLFYDGLGIAKDHLKTKYWFQKAYDNGYENALRMLNKIKAENE